MRRKRFVIGAFLTAGIALIAVFSVYLAVFRANAPEPDVYQPYPIDEYIVLQESIAPSDDISFLAASAYTVGIRAQLHVSENGGCQIDFINPDANRLYLLFDFRLLDRVDSEYGTLLYRTGMIPPGYGLQEIMLSYEAMELIRAVEGEVYILLRVYSFALENYLSMGEIDLRLPLNMDGSE